MASSDLNQSPVQKVLYEFARAHGMSPDASVDPLGVEIEIEGRKLRILPADMSDVVVLEVDVCDLSQSQLDSAELMLELHRLNHEGRFVHGWTVMIDDSDTLIVSVSVPVAAAGAEDLPGWIGEGLERAEALAQVVEALVNLDEAPAKAVGSGRSEAGAALIRG